jgi:hypothetical protein
LKNRMFGGTRSVLTTNCTRFSTEDAVRIDNSFYYNPTHTSLLSLTIIYYAVTRLHSYNPYTFVTAIAFFTLARLHSLQTLHSIFTALLHIKSPNLLSVSSLVDFSAIGHFHRLSRTVAHAKSSLHTAKLLPRSHSANSLLKTPS